MSPRTKKESSTEETSKKTKTSSEQSAFTNRTSFVNAQTAKRNWYLIDAKDKNLGRLCIEIVRILRGKRKANFTPNADNGDFVVVVNADKVTFTGKNKADQTLYHRYTGFPGGLRVESLGQLLKRIPERVIHNIVRKMMPKESTLSTAQLTKLKVYAGSEHPHSAQKPVLLETIPAI